MSLRWPLGRRRTKKQKGLGAVQQKANVFRVDWGGGGGGWRAWGREGDVAASRMAVPLETAQILRADGCGVMGAWQHGACGRGSVSALGILMGGGGHMCTRGAEGGGVGWDGMGGCPQPVLDGP